MRAALGAGAWRIMRTLLIESALLGVAGGALGVALAYGALTLIKRLAPATLPRIDAIALDARALVFTLAVSAIAGVALGLVPALRYAGPKIDAALRAGGRSGTQSRAQYRAQNVLVVAQVALALVLLVSSGLMIRTFEALRDRRPRLHAAASRSRSRGSRFPRSSSPSHERHAQCRTTILDAVAAIPSVSSVGLRDRDADGRRADGTWDGISSRTSRASRARRPRDAQL